MKFVGLVFVLVVGIASGAYDDGTARNKFLAMSAAAYEDSDAKTCVANTFKSGQVSGSLVAKI